MLERKTDDYVKMMVITFVNSCHGVTCGIGNYHKIIVLNGTV